MKWMPWLSRDLKKGGRKTVEKLGIAWIVAFVAPPSRMFLATLSKNTLIFRYNVRSALPRTLAETSWKLTWKASMACLFEYLAIKNQSNSQICADIDMEVLSKMRSVRGEMGELIWLCCECDYSHIKKTNTFRHVEAKHVICEYLCPICNQPNSCRNALKQHMIRLHSFGVNKWKTNKWLPRLVNLVCLVFFSWYSLGWCWQYQEPCGAAHLSSLRQWRKWSLWQMN